MEGIGVEVISSVGFPIFAFILMYRFARESLKENTKAIRELRIELQNQHE